MTIQGSVWYSIVLLCFLSQSFNSTMGMEPFLLFLLRSFCHQSPAHSLHNLSKVPCESCSSACFFYYIAVYFDSRGKALELWLEPPGVLWVPASSPQPLKDPGALLHLQPCLDPPFGSSPYLCAFCFVDIVALVLYPVATLLIATSQTVPLFSFTDRT